MSSAFKVSMLGEVGTMVPVCDPGDIHVLYVQITACVEVPRRGPGNTWQQAVFLQL